MVASVVTEGDLLVGLGAGTITDWINALPAKLASQEGAS
jgi:UDP-N-acetylmuramate-alanine ligase